MLCGNIRGLNATLTDEGIHLLPEINIGVAVALEDGLVVPVVRNADKERLSEISAQVRSFAERARNNQLTPGELQGGTFTITNLGNFGIDAVHAYHQSTGECYSWGRTDSEEASCS